jgi:hypothetical protein
MVSSVMVKSVVHFELIFVCDVQDEPNFIFCLPSFPNTIC